MRQLVFATNNPHKLQEVREIISSLGLAVHIVGLSETGCHEEIPETADTLEGNAAQKALWVKERYGCDCFADDTGLFVEALNGAPGVMTARYADEHCSPADNIRLLLKNLQGIGNRRAEFRTVIALATEQGVKNFEGVVKGSIATEPSKGGEGFGYDPVFVPDETGIPFAEMPSKDKNAISHRGRATQQFVKYLTTIG